MIRRTRIPGLVDLVRVDDLATIRALDADPRLDRDFTPRLGPLFNRVIAGGVRGVLHVGGHPFAAVAPRGDQARAERQAELEGLLAGRAPDLGEVVALAIWLRGGAGEEALGRAAQQAVGRLFTPDFVATQATWRAARLIDAAPRNPIRRLAWALGGRIEAARRELRQAVGDDPAAMHAVGVAVHTLVRSLEAMRALWREVGPASLTPAAAAARALRAPRQVVRRWKARADTLAGDVFPGTLTLFELDAARARRPGDETTFMSASWARCPAYRWTRSLLEAVWAEAAAMEAPAARVS